VGLYDEIQADVAEAFNTDLADAVNSCVYVTIDSVYDPISGGVVETRVNKDSRGVFSPYKSQDVGSSQGAILSTDTKALIMDIDLLNVTPKINDNIELNTKNYRVLDVKRDPANCAYTMQIRVSGQ